MFGLPLSTDRRIPPIALSARFPFVLRSFAVGQVGRERETWVRVVRST